jgi:PIN domain nuclease of toxin-antitoxin system
MKLLLDTHIFLWLISGDEKLPEIAKDAICDSQNEVFLSVASLWEIIIKNQIGKLPLPENPATFLPEQRKLHQIQSLAIDEKSATVLATLPQLHRDPFDRILVCQAIYHDLTIITVDHILQTYPVKLLDLT